MTQKIIYAEAGMKRVSDLIDFIRTKPDEVDSVLIESDKFELTVPIDDRDVMCMKVISFISSEYKGHSVGEAADMLHDTVWWLTTLAIAFAGDETEEPNDTA